MIGIAKDFVETEQAELDLSCVGCHMPGLRGPIANDPPGEASETRYPVRQRRNHRLMTPRDPQFLASAFRLEARMQDGRPVLVIENTTGHRVPGLTRRKLTFEARVIDDAGDVVAEARQVFDHKTFLPVEGIFELTLDEPGKVLEVEGHHEVEGMRRPMTFLKRSLSL